MLVKLNVFRLGNCVLLKIMEKSVYGRRVGAKFKPHFGKNLVIGSGNYAFNSAIYSCVVQLSLAQAASGLAYEVLPVG